MATTPTRISAASTTREVTKPIAALRLTRRATGQSSTAVATPEAARQELQHRSPLQGSVAARVADDLAGIRDDVARAASAAGSRRRNVYEVGRRPAGQGDLPRGLHPPVGERCLLVVAACAAAAGVSLAMVCSFEVVVRGRCAAGRRRPVPAAGRSTSAWRDGGDGHERKAEVADRAAAAGHAGPTGRRRVRRERSCGRRRPRVRCHACRTRRPSAQRGVPSTGSRTGRALGSADDAASFSPPFLRCSVEHVEGWPPM